MSDNPTIAAKAAKLGISFRFLPKAPRPFAVGDLDFEPDWPGLQVQLIHWLDSNPFCLMVEPAGGLSPAIAGDAPDFPINHRELGPMLAWIEAYLWTARYGGPYTVAPWASWAVAYSRANDELLSMGDTRWFPVTDDDYRKHLKAGLASTYPMDNRPNWNEWVQEFQAKL